MLNYAHLTVRLFLCVGLQTLSPPLQVSSARQHSSTLPNKRHFAAMHSARTSVRCVGLVQQPFLSYLYSTCHFYALGLWILARGHIIREKRMVCRSNLRHYPMFPRIA